MYIAFTDNHFDPTKDRNPTTRVATNKQITPLYSPRYPQQEYLTWNIYLELGGTFIATLPPSFAVLRANLLTAEDWSITWSLK